MSLTLPNLCVGEPICHEALSVFPLFCDAHSNLKYELSDAALAGGSLLVEEISEGGSVPDLLVENRGDTRVLFLEGEELVGAKQNRILNTSVLVAGHSKVKIPVSCVEQGRWRYQSRRFGSSGSHIPTKLRRALKTSVSSSIKRKRGHRSDQGEIWNEVEQLHASHDVESRTAAMSDAFDQCRDRIEAYRSRLAYVEDAVGLAVAIGDRVVSLDLFDKPETCRKVWNRLLSGVVFDAVEAGETERRASIADVEQLVAAVGDLPWEQSEAVAEGEEYRVVSKRGDQGSVLAFEQVVVHGSVMAAE